MSKRLTEKTEELQIRETNAGDPVLRGLIARLDQELYERYPADEVHTLDLDDPSMDEVTFIVAEAGGAPVGCGAIRPLDCTYIELKRFFVDAGCRRKGIASCMLAYLEMRALQRGFRKLRLETGDEQPESIALYRKHGFEPIERYGEYVHCESSRCFEKTICAR